jgi:hypothetical protein
VEVTANISARHAYTALPFCSCIIKWEVWRLFSLVNTVSRHSGNGTELSQNYCTSFGGPKFGWDILCEVCIWLNCTGYIMVLTNHVPNLKLIPWKTIMKGKLTVGQQT